MHSIRNIGKLIRDTAARHQLIVLLVGSILLSIAITVLSVSLYVRSGAQELDLSRPGYESIRDDVSQDERRRAEFTAQGELGPEELKDFRAQFDSQQNTLNELGNYDDKALSDEALRLFR